MHHHQFGEGIILKHEIFECEEDQIKKQKSKIQVHFDGDNSPRWLNVGEIIRPDPSKFFPFGFGKRTCPGNDFAIREAKCVVKTIASKYKIEIQGGKVRRDLDKEYEEKKDDERDIPYPMERGFNIHLKNPVYIRFVERNKLENVIECKKKGSETSVENDTSNIVFRFT